MQEAQETWVRSLGQKDPLEEEMATYSSIVAWRILWTEEPGGLQSIGLQRTGQDSGDLPCICFVINVSNEICHHFEEMMSLTNILTFSTIMNYKKLLSKM